MPASLIVAAVLAFNPAAGLQEKADKPKKDPFKVALSPLDRFVGRWEGTSQGPAGEGKATCQIRKQLGGKIYVISSQADFPKTEKSDGEKRGDTGIVSLNKADGKVTLRQYHSEGFFNRYTMDVQDDGKKLVFTSNLIENFSPGWSARLTLTLTGEDSFDDQLELKQPDKEWFRVAGSSYKRIKRRARKQPPEKKSAEKKSAGKKQPAGK